MNKKQQELFVSFFQELYEAEEAALDIKKKMAKCLGYNPVLLFQILSGGQSVITIPQLRDYLTTRIACNERELYDIFERFDWSRQGSISLDDFIIQLTPFGQAPFNQRNRSGTVTPEVEGHFISLIAEYIERLRIIEVSRNEINFIAPYNAFLEIDYMRTGLIGLGELQRFFMVNDFQINDFQLRLLLHALRRRCYIQVNLQVFCENLFPLQFGEYQAYAAEIRGYEEEQFLKRSRKEEETMRRSRIQSQKIDHQIQKQQRRKRAELQRQLELEKRINQEIMGHQEQKDRYYRRAVMEEDKNIRWNVQLGSRGLEEERIRNELERQRNAELSVVRNQENYTKDNLASSALRREDELEASRRARVYQQQLALRNEIERDRQLRKKQYLVNLDESRRRYEEEMRLERQKVMRDYQVERLRNQKYSYDIGQPIYDDSRRAPPAPAQSRRAPPAPAQSRRTPGQSRKFADSRKTPVDSQKLNRDYENQYQNRLQSRIKNTWSGKRGMPETAERSYGGY